MKSAHTDLGGEEEGGGFPDLAGGCSWRAVLARQLGKINKRLNFSRRYESSDGNNQAKSANSIICLPPPLTVSLLLGTFVRDLAFPLNPLSRFLKAGREPSEGGQLEPPIALPLSQKLQ